MKNLNEPANMTIKKREITFLDSFEADVSVVPVIIDTLISHLKDQRYPQPDIDEIVLSMDESVTNAIQGTIKKNRSMGFSGGMKEITIRYTISSDEFHATVIDHGSGLDLFNKLEEVPDMNSDSYHNQVILYASDSEKNKIRVTVNGEEIPLKGIGAGLKIILHFMDSVTIDLIDRKHMISPMVSETTDGTILNMKRRPRYRETRR